MKSELELSDFAQRKYNMHTLTCSHMDTHTPTCTHKSTSRKRLFSVVCILGLKNVFWRFSCDWIGNKVSQCRRGSFMSSDCFRWGFMSGDVSLYNYCFCCCLREKIGSRALRQRRQHRHRKQNGFKPWKKNCYKQTNTQNSNSQGLPVDMGREVKSRWSEQQ